MLPNTVETSIVCETSRLILRKFNESDVESLLSFLGDPEVMRFSIRGPVTREEIQTRYLPGCFHWIQGMTALDAIHAAGGFTNFVSGPILITHVDRTCEIWDYPPATIDATNEPPMLSRNVDVYVRIF